MAEGGRARRAGTAAEPGTKPLHIAVAGPMTLQLLEHELGSTVPTAGNPFPAIAQLALEYLARGHRVTAVTTGTDIDRPVRIHSERFDLVVLPARGRGRGRAFDLFRRERRAVRAELDAAAPDVVHAHWTYEFGLAARAARPPALVTVHDWAPAIARYNHHPYWYFRWVMQVLCLARTGPLSAPSEYLAALVERTYHHGCVVIPNGIDLDPFLEVAPSDGPPVVAMLNVGFTDRKNVITALQAWPLVRRDHPDAVLALAGLDFDEQGVAADWAREHGLTDGVRFDGILTPDAVPGWMADSTVFLHTSREESFGIVLVEAMAAGLPVVVGTRSGAASTVVGPAGTLVDVEDAAAVAAAVSDLLSDAERRRDRGALGREVARRYSVAASADAYLEQLQRITRTRSGGSPEGRTAS